MTSIDDLRSTLERRADAVDDTERHIRPTAVRARVRAARRRRLAASCVAVIIVLAGTAATIGALRGPGSVRPASVLGLDLPRSIAVSGFPYTLSSAREVDADLHLDDAEHERVVTLVATGLGSGSATLFSGDEPVARVRGDQHSAAPVTVGDLGTDLRVERDGVPAGARTALAVYEATGALAPGVVNADHTSVFRDHVAGNPLVAGAFASPGAREVRLEASGSLRDLELVAYCAGDGALWINVSVDGGGPLSSSCGDAYRDASLGTWASFPGDASGKDHEVRVYLTRGADGPEVEPQGTDFGVAVYRHSRDDQLVLGQRIPARVEYGGRTFVLEGAVVAPTTVDTSDSDALLGLVAHGRDVNLAWRGATTSTGQGSVTLGNGGLTTTAGLLLAGDRYEVRVTGDTRAARVLVYRPE